MRGTRMPKWNENSVASCVEQAMRKNSPATPFRTGYVEQQSPRSYGRVVIARSRLATVVAVGSLATIVLVFLLIGFAGFSRKEHVTGIVVPDSGLVRVVPPQAGTVSSILVQHGEAVAVGQPLFRLQTERATFLGSTQALVKSSLDQRISALEREKRDVESIASIQNKSLAARAEQLTNQLTQIDLELRLLSSRVEIAESSLSRSQSLSQSGFLSSTQVQEKRSDVLDQSIRLESLRRTRKSTEIEILAIQSEMRELPLRSARDRSNLDRTVSELQAALAENESRKELTVLAPVAGTIIASNLVVGSSLQATSNPVSIVPDGSKLVVDLYCPSRAIGFAKVGNPVLLRYTAFPYQKFGQHQGKVVEISNAPTQTSDLPAGVFDTTSVEPVYRVRVAIDRPTITAYGREEKLAVGMRVEASLTLEFRQIYEWILDPLFSVWGRL